MSTPSTVFSPLESALLRELQTYLRSDAADLLDKQLQKINLVQRHADSREVCCYSMERGTISHDPRVQFPATDRELQLATITFSCPSSERQWVGKLFLVQGYFFSIVFDSPPKDIMQCDVPRIERVQLHCDPMRAGTQEITHHRAATTLQLPSWVSQISDSISQIDEPLERENRDRILHRLNAKLPDDYLELMERCDGLVVDDWSIFGLSQIYEIHQPQGDYYVLAELHGYGVLTADPRDGLLYYFRYSSTDPLPVGKSFFAALSTAKML
jgi:hypothetical protein